MDISLFKEYFQLRKDVGEHGFWIDSTMTDGNSDNRIKELEKINRRIMECRACPLGSYRLKPCPGNGSCDADLMFVGEGPGYEEDHKGEVFVGKAGKLLDRILENALGLKRESVYITNIVKCHSMKDPSDPQKRGNDRPPSESESETCIELYLISQIKLIQPRIIVTLGSPATKALLNTSRGIMELRGKVFDAVFGNLRVKIIPTYHPSYLLRYPDRKKEAFEDTKIIRSLL